MQFVGIEIAPGGTHGVGLEDLMARQQYLMDTFHPAGSP